MIKSKVMGPGGRLRRVLPVLNRLDPSGELSITSYEDNPRRQRDHVVISAAPLRRRRRSSFTSSATRINRELTRLEGCRWLLRKAAALRKGVWKKRPRSGLTKTLKAGGHALTRDTFVQFNGKAWPLLCRPFLCKASVYASRDLPGPFLSRNVFRRRFFCSHPGCYLPPLYRRSAKVRSKDLSTCCVQEIRQGK